jgi:transketolase
MKLSSMENNKSDIAFLKETARSIRREILQMVARVKSSHIGGSFSVVDLLTALYFSFLHIDPKQPLLPTRDRLIFSKGHCAAALYAVLAERGFTSKNVLNDYFADGKLLTGHPTKNCLPGVEISTGSLGHGLPIGAGFAYAAKQDSASYRTVVVMSDGECNEGSVWEAALFAAHHKLDNLLAIIDHNKLQGFGRTDEVLSLEPFVEKWKAFGWGVEEVKGHGFAEILISLDRTPFIKGRPSVIIAHTIKGRGVSFMENTLDWHYKYPNGEELARALKELE